MALIFGDALDAYFTTNVPGIGTASTQIPSAFSTWRAWMPFCCHRIVKHYFDMSDYVFENYPEDTCLVAIVNWNMVNAWPALGDYTHSVCAPIPSTRSSTVPVWGG